MMNQFLYFVAVAVVVVVVVVVVSVAVLFVVDDNRQSMGIIEIRPLWG